MADSYLRLIPAAIADAIVASTSAARKRFAVACANIAVEHCANGFLRADDGAEPTLSELRDRALPVADSRDAREPREPREIEEIDRLLARREDQLYAQVSALRANENEAPYSEFMRLATQRHAIRALRAALLNDGFSAAARAAFETISATRNEQKIEELARELMRPA